MRCLRCRRSKSCQEEALVAGAVVRQMLCRQRALADAVVRCALMSMMLYGSSFASESGDRYAMLSAMRNLGEVEGVSSDGHVRMEAEAEAERCCWRAKHRPTAIGIRRRHPLHHCVMLVQHSTVPVAHPYV